MSALVDRLRDMRSECETSDGGAVDKAALDAAIALLEAHAKLDKAAVAGDDELALGFDSDQSEWFVDSRYGCGDTSTTSTGALLAWAKERTL